VGALKQYWLYWRIERKGASPAWCQAGKQRAVAQIRSALVEMARLVMAIAAAVSVSLLIYVLTGGK